MKNIFIFLFVLFFSTAGLHAWFPGSGNAIRPANSHNFVPVPAAHKLATVTTESCVPIRFVKQGASGSGESWADASGDLQAMIDLQAACVGGEVWVAAGTYIPAHRADAIGILTPNDRNNAFVLRTNVKVFGGFAGTEAVLSERVLNPGAPSVLSGDFNGDDVISGAGETLTITGNGENALHVVISAGNVSSAVLDGFTVTGGFANGANANLISINSVGIIGSRGGGMFIRSSSPGIANCLFEGNATSPDNSTFGSGAGIYCEGPVVISASIFSRNSAYLGGGMLVLNGSVTLNNCAFSGNRASEGGGLNNNAGSNSKVTACTFTGNYADVAGGGLLTSTIVNVTGSTFVNNTAVSNGGGGGIRIFASGNATIDACTFSGNRVTGSSGRGGAINNSVSLTVTGSTFSGNEAVSGGGISHNGTLANISGSSFNNNKATEGGAIKTFSSSLMLQDVILSNNSAVDGGGLFNSDASPQVSNVTFSGNSATNSGGGMLNFTPSPEARISARIASPAVKRSVPQNANGYGVPAVTSVADFTDEFTEAPSNRGLRVAAASPTVINSTFTNNTSGGSGGGICNIRSSPVVVNTLIAGNTAGSPGGGIRNQEGSNGSFINTTIANNTADTGGGVANLNSNPATPTKATDYQWLFLFSDTFRTNYI